jgi:hypothetical protein
MRLKSLGRVATLASFGFGCQAVLGDFTVEKVPPEVVTLGAACVPAAARCEGASLEVCGPDRSGFVKLEDCGSADACDPTAVACHRCVAGDFACNGSEVLRCSDNGTWQFQKSCLSAELCFVSEDRKLGDCNDPEQGCTAPGRYICEGHRLLRCSSGLDRIDLVEPCASADHCDEDAVNAAVAAGEDPHCLPACAAGECGTECEPGTMRCNHGGYPDLDRCSADGRWEGHDGCQNAALCSLEARACLEPACAAGEFRCRGQILERCTADRTRFEEVARCAAGELCEAYAATGDLDPAGGCRAGPCIELSFRCNSATLELCEGGTWQPRQRCATPELCDSTSGECVDPACKFNRYFCDGQRFHVCPLSRDAWIERSTCMEPLTCTTYPDVNETIRGCELEPPVL